MKKLKLKSLKIVFNDDMIIETSGTDIEHIETTANSDNFIVKVHHRHIRADTCVTTYIYKIDRIKEIEQRWEG